MLVILTANYQDQLGLSGKNKGDTEKFPEFLQKNNLKCLYKFEILVPFKVLPLWPDTMIPAPLPQLETLSEIFNRNALKDRSLTAIVLHSLWL